RRHGGVGRASLEDFGWIAAGSACPFRGRASADGLLGCSEEGANVCGNLVRVLPIDGVGGLGIDANRPMLEAAAGEICSGGGVVHRGSPGHDDHDRLPHGRGLVLGGEGGGGGGG